MSSRESYAGKTGNNVHDLRIDEPQFAAFVTSDQNLKHQQNIAGRKLAILVLSTNDWPTIKRLGERIAAKVATLKPGDFVEMTLG